MEKHTRPRVDSRATEHAEDVQCPGVTRRAFLGRSFVGTAVVSAALTNHANAQETAKTRIAYIKNAQATDDAGAGRADVVREMVDRAMRELTGKDSLADAWKQFVKPDDVVGIKINLRGGPSLSPQPCVVDSIVAGLVAAGVKENNIIVWDILTNEFQPAGFTINMGGQGVRYYATEKGILEKEKPPTKEEADELRRPFHTSEPFQVGDKQVWLSKILTEEITALINVPLVKDHVVAGVTCSMKNHYGSILNPSDLHGNNCDPYVPALNALAPIKEKTRLILVDGLRALYNGGPHDQPQWRWRENAVIAATDTVAVDTLALRIVEEKRKEAGMDPVTPRAHYLETAAKMQLGTNDLTQVDLREIDLTSA